MKNYFFAFFAFFYSSFASAQWTEDNRVISTADYVGIGITIPETKFHIHDGAMKFSFTKLESNQGNYSLYNGIQFATDNENSSVYSSIKLYRGQWSSHLGLRIQTMYGVDNSIDAMQINPNGFIGIGVLEPKSKLNVHDGNIRLSFSKSSETAQGNNVLYNGIQFTTDNENAYTAIRLYRGDNSYRLGLRFQTVNSSTYSLIDAMSILPNGNVGIGTVDPKNKLSVNGIVWAQEVKVTLNDAADWVFEENYNLRPIEEVESYIRKNSHLPDMPSADDFRNEGLNVAEMDNKLLQKIEELTLYLIDQNKEITNLKNEIKLLKAVDK